MFLFQDSLITYTDKCRPISVQVPVKINNFNNDVQIFHNLSDNNRNQIKEIILIEIKSYAEIVSYKSNKIQLKRIKPLYCDECGRKHEYQNPYIIVSFGKTAKIKLYCGRNNEGKFKILGEIPLSKDIIQDIK
jgi:hypothetical protein